MKFICLGYADPSKWETMSEEERSSAIEECFAYDDELRRGGHFLGGEALQLGRNGVTLRIRSGKVEVIDGPYAETKEQLGGYYLIDVKNLDEAITFAGRLPPAKKGTIEIRPVFELATLPMSSVQK